MKKVYIAVLYVLCALAIDLAMTTPVNAQDAATSAAVVQVQAASQPQAVAPSTIATPAPALVAVPEPAAPPQWAIDVLMSAAKLPIIGPYVSKALLYAGILAALLTSLVAFLLGAVALLSQAFGWAGLTNFSNALAAFKGSQFMYWLTYFSNFNAKKPS